jgi:hypothetical protein
MRVTEDSDWSVTMPHRLGRAIYYLLIMVIVPGLIAIQGGTKSWPFLLVVLAIAVGLVCRTARLRVELREEVFLCHRILPTRDRVS